MASSHNAHAGRPLTVDDASVNELGGGHVEFWFARLPGQSNVWHVSPAYSPIKGFEVSALLSRDRTGSETTKAIQGKYLFTPSNPDGCNFGTSFGTGYVNELRRQTPYLSGLATCNGNLGSAHLNLGVSKAEGESSVGVWGIAFERELGGGVTGHIERFGQKHVHPSMQVGIRKEIMSGLQIDGTLGRYADDSIYSIGIKKTF
jgi:hypothetical protein